MGKRGLLLIFDIFLPLFLLFLRSFSLLPLLPFPTSVSSFPPLLFLHLFLVRMFSISFTRSSFSSTSSFYVERCKIKCIVNYIEAIFSSISPPLFFLIYSSSSLLLFFHFLSVLPVLSSCFSTSSMPGISSVSSTSSFSLTSSLSMEKMHTAKYILKYIKAIPSAISHPPCSFSYPISSPLPLLFCSFSSLLLLLLLHLFLILLLFHIFYLLLLYLLLFLNVSHCV